MFPVPFACPYCHSPLEHLREAMRCIGCGASYDIHDDIPLLISTQHQIEGQFDYLEHYRRDNAACDYFEPRTGATAHGERRLREFILSKIPRNVKSILDVGCGSAWIAKAYQRSAVAVCSMDVTAVNPRKALELYPSDNHIGVAGDAFHLPFADGSLECIVAAEVIEHLPDTDRLLSEMLRVLAPRGTLVVSTPYDEKIVFEVCIHCGQLTPRNAHLHSFDEQRLSKCIPDQPATTVAAWTFNNKALIHGRAHVLLRYTPFTLWRAIDRLANLVVRHPANLVAVIRKS